MNHGYQIMQSKIAVGSGKVFGKGFMEGTQGHLHFLPERHTDFAFAVWGEEWGFAGALFFLSCYFFLLIWSINVVMSAKDKLGALLAFGCTMLIFWQAVINLCMIMGFLPVVGVPLPLFSYGGSSLLTNIFVYIRPLLLCRVHTYSDPDFVFSAQQGHHRAALPDDARARGRGSEAASRTRARRRAEVQQ